MKKESKKSAGLPIKRRHSSRAGLWIKNNRYIMGFAWRICPERVLSSGLHFGLDQFEYLFFSGFFMKRVLSLIEKGGSFQDILFFLGVTIGLFFLFFSSTAGMTIFWCPSLT